MTHPLNVDPFQRRAQNEEDFGTKHPSRFEADQSTISATQPQQRMRALIYNTTNPAINSGAATAVSFDHGVFDSAGLSGAIVTVSGTVITTTTKLTIPSTGKVTGTWQISGQASWPAAAGGTKRVTQIRKNGTTILATAQVAPTAQVLLQQISVLINDPSLGDFYELIVTQDSGGILAITGGQDQTFFQAIHLW